MYIHIQISWALVVNILCINILILALAQRSGQVAMLALDWAKAFDSINVDSLISALSLFGIPAKMLRILKHNYDD